MWTPHLLTLNALRVFHAAARHENFRTAADELLVSPQAVSQRIKILDYALGVALVERVGSGIRFSEQGMMFSQFVQRAFDEIVEGVKRISKTSARDRVNADAHFATRIPVRSPRQLPGEGEPGIGVCMTTMLETPDFATDEIEVSIQLKRVAAFCDWVTSEHWATQTQRQGKEADGTVS